MATLTEVQNYPEARVTSPSGAPKRLHLGCFDRPLNGWVNTDITPHIWIARVPGLARLLYSLGRMTAGRYEQHRKGIFRQIRYVNVAKRFPYPDNFFETVFSSHMLEHLYPRDARHCLSEILRTLHPGGVCRIAVPDLDVFINSYDPMHPDEFMKKVLEPSEFQKNTHHWLYNAHSLIALFREIGFRKAYRCNYREGDCPDLETLDNRPELSLYVEGTK